MDTELVTRAQGGDQEAFADLVYDMAAPSQANPTKTLPRSFRRPKAA